MPGVNLLLCVILHLVNFAINVKVEPSFYSTLQPWAVAQLTCHSIFARSLHCRLFSLLCAGPGALVFAFYHERSACVDRSPNYNVRSEQAQ